MLITNQIYEQGYISYNMENLTKLQHILFLRVLELTLEEIKQYFECTVDEKNKILGCKMGALHLIKQLTTLKNSNVFYRFK